METPIEKPVKLGIKIEKPSEMGLHPVYPFLLLLSFLFILGTSWLLLTEYLDEPLPPWIHSLLNNFILTL